MQKIVAILLLMIYSVCSTGATIHLHHCGKTTSVSINPDDKVSHDNCPLCKKEHEDHDHEDNAYCHVEHTCKDRLLELKSESEQLQTKSSLNSMLNLAPAIVLIPWIYEQWKVIVEDKHPLISHYASVPIQDLEPVYILNCTYRI